MNRDKDFTRHLLPIIAGIAAGAATGSVILSPSAAHADGQARPVMTRKALEQVVREHPNMRIDPRNSNRALLTDDWTGVEFSTEEEKVVPAEQRRHDHDFRRALALGGEDSMVSTINAVSLSTGDYLSDGSFDIWILRTLPNLVQPARPKPVQVNFNDGTSRLYQPDIIQTHWKTREHKDIVNTINSVRLAKGMSPMSESQVKDYMMLNARQGMSLDRNKIRVLRWFSQNYGSVVNVYEGRGDMVWDIMYKCPLTGKCLGTDGRPIEHLNKKGQMVLIKDQNYKLVHIKLDKIISGTNIPGLGMYVAGYITKKGMYGEPVLAAASQPVVEPQPPKVVTRTVIIREPVPAPAPTQAPRPECSDGIDNDGDGKIDHNDPDCYTDGKYNPNRDSETGRKKVPEKKDDPNVVIGAAFLYLPNNFLPEAAKMFELEIGGRVSQNLYLIGSAGYGYAGSSTVVDPRSRTTPANPLDDFGLGARYQAEDSTTAHLLQLGLGLSYRVAPMLQIGIGGDLYVPFILRERTGTEAILYPNGEVAKQEPVPDAGKSTDISVMGGPGASIDLRVNKHFSIGVKGSAAFGRDGKKMGGGGVTLKGYF